MLKCNQRVTEFSYQVSELHGEAAIGVVLNVHNFSIVGQNEKLTTSDVSKDKGKQKGLRNCVDSINSAKKVFT